MKEQLSYDIKLAAFTGICPYLHESDSSIRKPTRSAHDKPLCYEINSIWQPDKNVNHTIQSIYQLIHFLNALD